MAETVEGRAGITKRQRNLLIAHRLSKARELEGYSQKDAAEALQVSQAVFSNIELGKRQLAAWEVSILAELFGVDPRYLLGMRDTP